MSSENKDSPPARSDGYADAYMSGVGRVLLRDSAVSRGLALLLGFVTLWCGGSAVATFLGALPKSSLGAAVLLTVMTAFFAFLTATLTVLRTVVSDGEVHVQYGLWGPRVPVARIRSCRVTPYDWKKFGGWGIRRSVDGTRAYVLKSGGGVVELCYTDESGEDRTVLFSASDPAAVVAAIELARATASRPRIATDESRPEDTSDVDQEAEREQAAEQEIEQDVPGESRRN